MDNLLTIVTIYLSIIYSITIMNISFNDRIVSE